MVKSQKEEIDMLKATGNKNAQRDYIEKTTPKG
jgi:hypothetical protein